MRAGGGGFPLGIDGSQAFASPAEGSFRSATEVTVGTNGDYTTVTALFEDSGVAGDVVAKLTENVTEPGRTASSGPLSMPDRFTSLTIQSDSSCEWLLADGLDNEELGWLFANGRNLTIGANVTVRSDAGVHSPRILGGGYQQDVTGSPVVTIDGTVDGDVCGGGYRSVVAGDPQVVVNGEVHGDVAGGGFAQPLDEATAETAHADIAGSTAVVVGKGGFANTVIGGGCILASAGFASSPSSVDTLTAKVSGDCSIDVEGHIGYSDPALVGGGLVDIRGGSVSGDASVAGEASIVIGAAAQGKDWSEFPLVGGGRALVLTDDVAQSRATADVGAVTVSATQDENADYQDYGQMFGAFTGGGYANGVRAQANVARGVVVTTARASVDQHGLVGGGRAVNGAQANVNETVRVAIQSIGGQDYDYANAQVVIAGGFALAGNPQAGQAPEASVANVGGTELVVKKGASVSSAESGDFPVNLVGGGLAWDDGGSYADARAAQARVLRATRVELEAGVVVPDAVMGGGFAFGRGDASAQDSAVVVGNAARPGSTRGGLLGGGCASSGGSAGVVGNVSIEANGATLAKTYGGGRAEDDSCDADVGGNVSIALSGAGSSSSIYVAGDAHADVLGDADVVITGTQSKPVSLEGVGADESSSNVQGAVSLTVGDGVAPTEVPLYYAYAVDDVAVTDQATLSHASVGAGGGANKNKLFWGAETLSVASGGILALTNANSTADQEAVAGDFTGGGTVRLLSGKGLSIGGKASGDTAIEIDGTPQLGESYVTVAADGGGTFSYSDGGLVLANRETALPQRWRIVESASSHAVTASVYLNDRSWPDHGKTISLAKNGSSWANLVDVPDGSYDVCVDGIDTGVDVQVAGADAEARIDFYTVSFRIEDGDGASGSIVSATVGDSPLQSGAEVLKGSSVALTAEGHGATSYEYAWSGAGIVASSGSAIVVDGISAPVDAVCAVTGFAAPKPEENRIEGIRGGSLLEQGVSVSFAAIGAGMDNDAPSAGDYRWVPRSWKVNPSGVFDPAGPYVAQFDTAGMALGRHELVVTYGLERYDGSAWIDTGETGKNSLAFELVPPGSHQAPDAVPESGAGAGPGSHQGSAPSLAPTGDALSPIASAAFGCAALLSAALAALCAARLRRREGLR